MKHRGIKAIVVTLLLNLALQKPWALPPQIALSPNNNPIAHAPGQSATLLPDGSWLLLGGQGKNGAISAASIENLAQKTTTVLSNAMLFARAWHSATLLPDGRVLIPGGIGS